MRKIFLSLMFISSILTVQSQITKNNWLVGGSGSYAYTENNSEAYTNFKSVQYSITPKVGYFFIDKLAGGIATTISKYKTTYPADALSYGGKTTAYHYGPFARYYLLHPENSYNLFVEGVYQHQVRKDETTNVKSKQAANSYTFSAGPVIYFNSCVGIEFTVGYSSVKFEGFKGRDNSVVAGIGFQIHLEKEK